MKHYIEKLKMLFKIKISNKPISIPFSLFHFFNKVLFFFQLKEHSERFRERQRQRKREKYGFIEKDYRAKSHFPFFIASLPFCLCVCAIDSTGDCELMAYIQSFRVFGTLLQNWPPDNCFDWSMGKDYYQNRCLIRHYD